MKYEVLPLEDKWVIRRTTGFLWKKHKFLSTVTWYWFFSEHHVFNNCLFDTKAGAEEKLAQWLAYDKVFNG